MNNDSGLFRVGIAGLGGIGSQVAQILARSKVEYLCLVDFDRVEQTNLDRQFFFYDQIGRYKADMLEINLKRINPGITIETAHARLDPGNIIDIFKNCHVIVEGVDDKQTKKLVVEAFAGRVIPVVSASGIAGKDMNTVTVKSMGNLIVAGDLKTDEADAGLFPPKIHMVASLMAGEVLNLKKGVFK
ncbi:MAG: sulfur carrier protein ThiS adenylyltransferase ThiF [Thermodesulfobacteriota bacterium]|nr:sulfur carrier protein ThiS adenylyltransferase ThiF [Thermodesulfobacteriota bacterium]